MPSPARRASVSLVVVVFPFEPTTCMARNSRCGSPSALRSSRMRSSPNSSGHGLSDSSQARLRSAAERIELAAVAGELLALALDNVGRRVRDEAVVSKHPLRTGDLRAQALPLRFHIAVGLRPLRADNRVEDPLLLVVEGNAHAASPEHLGRVLDCLDSRLHLGFRSVELGPRSDDEATLARREVRPDLLGHVWHHRVHVFEEPFEKCERSRARVFITAVQARLDRFGVPVAEVVERDAVELRREPPEVEALPGFGVLRVESIEPPDDPLLLEALGPDRRPRLTDVRDDQPADVPELVRELTSLFHRTVRKT